MQKISTCLWFENRAERSRRVPCVFGDSRILDVSGFGVGGPGHAGQAITVEFEIESRKFMALNGGAAANFTEAVSFVVDCPDQEEVDRIAALQTAYNG